MLKNLILLSCLAYLVAGQNLNRICYDNRYRSNLPEGGCFRYVRGWDITGVTNTVQLTHMDGINNACDCMQACKSRSNNCASWVWKFTDNTEYRTCTLYSDFNLPPDVSISLDINTSRNVGQVAQNPHLGGKVPRCTNPQGGYDNNCYSGGLWYLDNDQFLC